MATNTIEPVDIRINVGIKDALKDLKTLEMAVVQLEKIKTRAAQNITKAAEKSSKDQTKAAQQHVKEETTLTQQLERTEITSMAKIVKAHEKAERDKTRATEREARAQQKAYEKTAQGIMAMMEKQARREAEILEQGRRARERFAQNVGNRFTNGISRGLGAATGLGTAALGIMGGFGIADSVRERANMHGLASAVAIQGSKTGGRQFNTQDVLGTATSEGIRTGRGTEDTIKALGKFTDLTGDLDKGKEVLKTISDYADASNTSLTDMAGAAGELFASGTVKNAKELSAALGTYVEMGKTGAVELKDFARNFAKITATAGLFGGDQANNALTLGAMGETAKRRGGAATPTIAMTAVQSFGSDVMGHMGKIKDQLGVGVRDNSGNVRSTQDILADIIVASKGKEEALTGGTGHASLFGRQGIRAIRGSIKTYNEAVSGASGTDAEKAEIGRAAVIKELTELSSKQLTADKALEQATIRRQEADRQFAIQMEKLKSTVGEALLPEVIKLIPELAKLTPMIADAAAGFAKLIGWFAQNPWTGLGAIVGAFLLKELALAFAMAGIQGGVTAGVLGTTNAIKGAGVVGGTGIAIGTAVATVGTGAIIGGAAENWDLRSNTMDKSQAEIESSMGGMDDVTRKIFGGKGTTEDLAAAKRKLAQEKARVTEAGKTNTGVVHSFDTGVGATLEGAAAMFGYKGHGQRDEAEKIVRDREVQDNKELSGAIKVLTAVIEKQTQVVGNREDFSGDGGRGNVNREQTLSQRGGSNH